MLYGYLARYLALGGMRKIASVIVLALAGCASVSAGLPAPADRHTVVGTWNGEDSQEIFEADGTYCAFSKAADSLGRWEYGPDGYITLQVTSSTDPKEMTPPEVSELRAVFSPEPSRLYMGYVCTHCQDGVLGAWFRRSTHPKACASRNTAMPPNKSFKPTPLRGAA